MTLKVEWHSNFRTLVWKIKATNGTLMICTAKICQSGVNYFALKVFFGKFWEHCCTVWWVPCIELVRERNAFFDNSTEKKKEFFVLKIFLLLQRTTSGIEENHKYEFENQDKTLFMQSLSDRIAKLHFIIMFRKKWQRSRKTLV